MREKRQIKTILCFATILFLFSISGKSYALVDQNDLYKLMPFVEEKRMIKATTEAVFIIYVNGWPVGDEEEVLDRSWIQIPDSEKEVYKITDTIFVVSFGNSKKNKTLYVLMINDEKYVITNFSGRFEWENGIIEPAPELNEESMYKNQRIKEYIRHVK